MVDVWGPPMGSSFSRGGKFSLLVYDVVTIFIENTSRKKPRKALIFQVI